MTPDERLSRGDWLGGLGVPVPFRDAIIDAPNNILTSRGGAIVGLAMVAVAVGVMAATFFWLEGDVEGQAATLAAQSGASLIHVNVGMGPTLLLFGILTLMGWVSSVLAGRYRVNGFLSYAAGLLNSPPKQGLTRRATQWMLSGSVRWAVGRSTTVEDFLRAVARHQARSWGMAAILLLLPAILLTALETNSFWVAGPAAILEHRMFPPFSNRRHELSDARGLTTGCNHTEKNNLLIYEVRLTSGERFDLGNTQPLKGNKIGAIEEIDAKIDRMIEHNRWEHLNRDPVHPACLNHWAAQFDRDGQRRLTKLLRLTAEEARGLPIR